MNSKTLTQSQIWDQRYKAKPDTIRSVNALLTQFSDHIPTKGYALDAASGLGQNADFLCKHGLKVVAADISMVGCKQTNKVFSNRNLSVINMDLLTFPFNVLSFDLIINFLFLERSLISKYKQAMKNNGLIIFQTFTKEMKQIKPELSDEKLLDKGELLSLFSDFEIIHFNEEWICTDKRQKAVASLVARKI